MGGCDLQAAILCLPGSGQKADRNAGLVSLVRRLVFGGQLGEKRTQARGRVWRMVVLVAKVEVESHPLVMRRA
jgi:hypothetical protein